MADFSLTGTVTIGTFTKAFTYCFWEWVALCIFC